MGGEVAGGINDVKLEELKGGGGRDEIPLGMRVRKFFKDYGYFDGSVQSKRRCIKDGYLQPAYRIVYDDGDCEDMLRGKIEGLRQLYDETHVTEAMPLSAQVEIGTVLETNAGRCTVVDLIDEVDAAVVRWGSTGEEVVAIVVLQEMVIGVCIGDESGVGDAVEEAVKRRKTKFLDITWR